MATISNELRAGLLRAVLASCVIMGVILATDSAYGQGKEVDSKWTQGGKSSSGKGTVDSGSTSSDPAASASEINRKVAKDLGIIKDDGTFDDSKLEKNDDGTVKKYKNTLADGTEVEYVQTKDTVEIEVTDDKGTKKKINIKVQVICDATKDGVNLLGEDALNALDATETFKKPRKITWNNSEESAPGQKEDPPKQNPGGGNRKLRHLMFPNVQGPNGFLPNVPMYMTLGIDYTFMPQSLIFQLGLVPTGEVVDLSDRPDLVQYLIDSGFYSSLWPPFFDVFSLPMMELVDPDTGGRVIWQNVSVLRNPVGQLTSIGGELLSFQPFGPDNPLLVDPLTGDRRRITQITYIEEDQFEAYYFSAGCPADFNNDGFVTGDDFDAYVAAFETGDPDADYNGDGFVTGDDFDAFVFDFESGC